MVRPNCSSISFCKFCERDASHAIGNAAFDQHRIAHTDSLEFFNAASTARWYDFRNFRLWPLRILDFWIVFSNGNDAWQSYRLGNGALGPYRGNWRECNQCVGHIGFSCHSNYNRAIFRWHTTGDDRRYIRISVLWSLQCSSSATV